MTTLPDHFHFQAALPRCPYCQTPYDHLPYAAIYRLLLETRIAVYEDCGSKAGSGAVTRGYATSRALAYKAQLATLEESEAV